MTPGTRDAPAAWEPARRTKRVLCPLAPLRVRSRLCSRRPRRDRRTQREDAGKRRGEGDGGRESEGRERFLLHTRLPPPAFPSRTREPLPLPPFFLLAAATAAAALEVFFPFLSFFLLLRPWVFPSPRPHLRGPRRRGFLPGPPGRKRPGFCFFFSSLGKHRLSYYYYSYYSYSYYITMTTTMTTTVTSPPRSRLFFLPSPPFAPVSRAPAAGRRGKREGEARGAAPLPPASPPPAPSPFPRFPFPPPSPSVPSPPRFPVSSSPPRPLFLPHPPRSPTPRPRGAEADAEEDAEEEREKEGGRRGWGRRPDPRGGPPPVACRLNETFPRATPLPPVVPCFFPATGRARE